MQVARLQPEVFAPAVRARHLVAGQRGHRRIERLEHRKGGHVDAADGPSDGVAAQMIGERFDLGELGHSTQSAWTTSDRSQLTIESTIAAQMAVHQKSSIASPQCVVCSVIHEVIHNMNALITMWKRPSVRM